MSADLIDRKKALVGRILIGLAILTAVICFFRDARTSIWGCLFVAFVGWGFVSGAKPKKERAPPKHAYLYFAVLVIFTFAAAILLAHLLR